MHVETWVFDLDNTLYEPCAGLFAQIDARMTGFIMRELGLAREVADRLRRDYWRRHGTTLRGLMAHHGTDPGRFLAEVHDIDLSALGPGPALAAALARLPGRKVIHTNGARVHAERVLAARGLAAQFDAIYAIEDKNYVPKPQRAAYDAILRRSGLDPARAAMIEDDARNLEVPKVLGMATVWLCHGRPGPAPAWVDHRAPALTGFLAGLA
ncbi:MAG TPA: pyrimidine 5'-nucleotidase [Thermohalobaculum sp.]|nr:pyrimidine 5'-nucleotidase [Thermohalobaculum sp.]